MKRCPTCNRTFTDPNLSFCLQDGMTLVEDERAPDLEKATEMFSSPPPTMQMPPPRPTERVGAFGNAPPSPQPYGWANDSPQVWRPPPPPARPTGGQQQTLAIISLVLGLLSITFGWICGGPVFGLFAVILGGIALMQIKSSPAQHTGKPFAIVGMITGGLALLVTIAMMAFWFIMLIIGSVSH